MPRREPRYAATTPLISEAPTWRLHPRLHAGVVAASCAATCEADQPVTQPDAMRHFISEERPDLCAAELIAFLARVVTDAVMGSDRSASAS